MNRSLLFLAIGILFTLFLSDKSVAQQRLREIKKVSEFSGKGVVEDIQPGEIIIRREDGKQRAFLIQDKDDRFLSLDGNDYIVSLPAKIHTVGTMPGKLLEKGMVVQFRGEINRSGRTGKPVKEIKVLSSEQDQLKLRPATDPSGKEMVPCDFIGIIQRLANKSMYLVVPKTRMTPTERVTVKLADDAFFDIEAEDLNRVRAGDQVTAFSGDKMANGAMVIRKIKIELTAERDVATTSFSDQLYLKYSKLSDEPGDAREERSQHFILYTDISPRSSKVLLEKLETMYGFLARYYRKKPREAIECYVVSDLDKFRGKLPAIGVQKIEQRTGVTASSRVSLMRGNKVKGKRTRSVVYSCDDQDVVQHEAVHAYCNMAFGTSGPVWYSEGMAEMGQYWSPNTEGVHIEPAVIAYLTTAEKKKMRDIVAAGQITGDSWKAYAWRWALCYLLAQNPNYSKRFRQLGVNLMLEKDDSFDKAFGKVADQIAFEYDQFVANFDNGYRADLCVWEWRDDAQKLESRAGVTVNAKQGWHATGIILENGKKYDLICPGVKNELGERVPQTWNIKKDKPISPNGNARGDGRLIGVILNDYKLSEPFDIGARKSGLEVPTTGQLYLRCQEKWNALADNEGKIKVYIRKSPEP